MHLGPFSFSWWNFSLGKFPTSLLHSFTSRRCVWNYLLLPSVQIKIETNIERVVAVVPLAVKLQPCPVLQQTLWRVTLKHHHHLWWPELRKKTFESSAVRDPVWERGAQWKSNFALGEDAATSASIQSVHPPQPSNASPLSLPLYTLQTHTHAFHTRTHTHTHLLRHGKAPMCNTQTTTHREC